MRIVVVDNTVVDWSTNDADFLKVGKLVYKKNVTKPYVDAQIVSVNELPPDLATMWYHYRYGEFMKTASR